MFGLRKRNYRTNRPNQFSPPPLQSLLFPPPLRSNYLTYLQFPGVSSTIRTKTPKNPLTLLNLPFPTDRAIPIRILILTMSMTMMMIKKPLLLLNMANFRRHHQILPTLIPPQNPLAPMTNRKFPVPLTLRAVLVVLDAKGSKRRSLPPSLQI